MTDDPVLGVLRLDYSYQPVLGDVDHPGSFAYKAIYRIVPGLSFEICQSGEITEEIRRNCIDAVRYLDSQGVRGITGDCGFMINIEPLVRDHTEKPVFLSSLDQLPLILTSIGPDAEVGVLTANSKTLHLIEARLDRLAGVVDHSPRIQILGCQNIPGFEAVAKGEKVDTAKVSKGLRDLVGDFLANNDKVKCLLFECTELGVYANEIRLMSGLPVYDAITHCDAFMSGFALDTRFGVQS
ncbi:MAG: hypothetical protein AAGC86_16640 [Pseudomonadota bacterium]